MATPSKRRLSGGWALPAGAPGPRTPLAQLAGSGAAKLVPLPRAPAPAVAAGVVRRKSGIFEARRKSFGAASPHSGGAAAAGAAQGVAAAGAAGSAENVQPNTQPNVAQLTSMYSEVIKLSAENKINQKNSWSLPLIDRLDEVIESSSGAGGTNFQKASCTLDASVKIYSCRVDDTHSSSFRVLEVLRTDGGDVENADAGVAKRATSKKHHVNSTIEADPAAITLESFDLAFDVDPLFHRMTQIFDKGGAKGMLHLNLPIHDGCSLVLDSGVYMMPTEPAPAAEAAAAAAAAQPVMVSAEPLADVFAALRASLASTALCPPLTEMADSIESMGGSVAAPSGDFGFAGLTAAAAASAAASGKAAAAAAAAGEDAADASCAAAVDAIAPPAGMSDDDDDDAGVDFGEFGDFGDFGGAGGESQLGGGADRRGSVGTCVTVPVGGAAAPRVTAQQAMAASIEALLMDEAPANDYAWFDPVKLGAIAASSHWKFLARKRAPAAASRGASAAAAGAAEEAGSGDEAGDAPANGKPRRRRRAEFVIDFAAPPVHVASAFAAPPRAATATQLTAAAREKARPVLLPATASYTLDSLLRLSLRPHAVVRRLRPMTEQEREVRMQAAADGSPLGSCAVGDGTGAAPAGALFADAAAAGGDAARLGVLEEGGGELGGFDAGGASDDDDDGDVTGFPGADVTFGDAAGTGVAGGLLAQPDHVVASTRVRYATQAKRVDVRRLKQNLWSVVHTRAPAMLDGMDADAFATSQVPVDAGAAAPALSQASEAGEAGALTFRAAVDAIAPQSSSEVTIPFYFICMLHLANENGLVFQGREDLSDFAICKL